MNNYEKNLILLSEYSSRLAAEYQLRPEQLQIVPHEKDHGAVATKEGIKIGRKWLENLSENFSEEYLHFIYDCPNKPHKIESHLKNYSMNELKHFRALSQKYLHHMKKEELQAVIRHEVGHIVHQHDGGLILKLAIGALTVAGISLSTFSGMVGMSGSQAFCENSRDPDCLANFAATMSAIAIFTLGAVAIGDLILIRKYFSRSQDNEREADAECNSFMSVHMHLLQKRMLVDTLLAKLAPETILEKIQSRFTNSLGQDLREILGLRTHPSFAERMQSAKKFSRLPVLRSQLSS